MKKYKIRWHRIQTDDWDEEVVDAENQEVAEEMARDAWFNVNEISYYAEELNVREKP